MIHILLLYLKNKRYVKRFKEMVHILSHKRLIISSSCGDKNCSQYFVLLNSAANLTKTRNYKKSLSNPTLGEFCFTMIGRANIEGSKGNVAMNALLSQASYPSNFCDTSCLKISRSKTSIGHTFAVCTKYQVSFCATRGFRSL